MQLFSQLCYLEVVKWHEPVGRGDFAMVAGMCELISKHDISSTTPSTLEPSTLLCSTFKLFGRMVSNEEFELVLYWYSIA